MKSILIVFALIGLVGCTTKSSEHAEGILVGVSEEEPKILACAYITVLTLQTAQSGQYQIRLGNVHSDQFLSHINKKVRIDNKSTHFYGCSENSVTITDVK